MAARAKTGSPPSAGYSVVELLISMAILMLLAGAVFQQINDMQRKSASEASKLDMNQQAREFVDQMVHDLHMAGYPGNSMYAPGTADNTRIAAGLVSVSPTDIQLEGDVDNDGNVESVHIYYVASDPDDPNCPCIRRGAVLKVASATQPSAAAYTEIQNVMPPGTEPGGSGEDLFAFYDQNGNQVTDPGKISTVKVNLTLLTNVPDPATGGPMRMSLSATARLSHQ